MLRINASLMLQPYLTHITRTSHSFNVVSEWSVAAAKQTPAKNVMVGHVKAIARRPSFVLACKMADHCFCTARL